MKHFTWLAAVGGVVVGTVIYWTNGTRDLVIQKNAEPAAAEANDPVRTAGKRRLDDEPIEPILVLPEVEVAPPPSAESATGSTPTTPPQRGAATVTRPDVRDGRLWMPYAAEDVELSATRRLEWVKLSLRDGAARRDGFEESEEPPLLEPKR